MIIEGMKIPMGFNHPRELPTTFKMIRNSVIDGHGKFKYIMIDIIDKMSGERKSVVRGQRWIFDDHEHFRIFKDQELQLMPENILKNLEIHATGGGMLIHTMRPDIKDIIVYGYSIPYGKGDHNKAHYILSQDFPSYKIRWSNSTHCNNIYETHHQSTSKVAKINSHAHQTCLDFYRDKAMNPGKTASILNQAKIMETTKMLKARNNEGNIDA